MQNLVVTLLVELEILLILFCNFQIVEAALAGVSAEGLDVVIVPEGIPGFIPAYHLSDHCDHWHPILTSYGQRLEAARGKQEMVKAVVTGKDQGSLLVWFDGGFGLLL